MAKKVFLNAGHGGSDPGAVANGFKEKTLNLSIANACCDELERHGVVVVMGRTKDVDATSSGIIKKCNSSGADLAVDIHNNAGGGDGAEVFYHYGGGTGKTLASNILNEIVKIGQNSRGIKTRRGSDGNDYYYFIRETTPPAVIVECAFVDNKTDIKVIDTASEQKKMGVAIAKGILKTLGISYKSSATASSKKVLDNQGYVKGKNSDGVLAIKELLLIAKTLGVHSQGVDENGIFGDGTQKAVNILLKKWGYAENGIAGDNFIKKLTAEIKKKI